MWSPRFSLAVVALPALLACDRPSSTEPVLLAPAFDAALRSAGGSRARVIFSSARGGTPKIYAMNADGTDQRPLTDGPGSDLWPDISPNGRYVAFASNRTGNNDIYVLNLKTGSLVNITNQVGDDNWPRWSPNGQRIAFHSNRDGNYNLYTVNPDGTELSQVTNDVALDQWPDWSPDGKRLAFRRAMDIYVVDADGVEGNVQRLTFLPATLDQMPVWSPNGKQIAFMSLREGYPSVFLMSADGDTPDDPAVNLTPKDPNDPASAWLSRAPAWSGNGREIYFMSFRPSTRDPVTGANNVDIFVMNADGTGVTRLTSAPGEDGGPRARQGRGSTSDDGT